MAVYAAPGWFIGNNITTHRRRKRVRCVARRLTSAFDCALRQILQHYPAVPRV